MFTKIDPLFKTLFRHAESADTREEIKRRDPEHEQRKSKKDAPDRKDRPLWEDETDVSIEALTSFLQTLLGDKKPVFNSNAGKTINNTNTGNEKASYAINAYKKTANEPTHSINITENEPTEEASSLSLDDKMRPVVEDLLEDLKELKKRDVEYLVISRNGTFFESVIEAIENAHNKFNL